MRPWRLTRIAGLVSLGALAWGQTQVQHAGTMRRMVYATYAVVSGTRAPVYGAGAGTYPPNASWTGLFNSSADDAYLTISLPFTFSIAGTGYTTTYLGSNSYFTFGSGATNYSSLSASNPAYPKMMYGAADNSYQRVSMVTYGSDYVRTRYEGTAATSGTAGSPNIVAEITFFNPTRTSGTNVVELLVGTHSRTGGVACVASSSSAYATYTVAANQSYVFVGNAAGTSWTIYTGYHVNY